MGGGSRILFHKLFFWGGVLRSCGVCMHYCLCSLTRPLHQGSIGPSAINLSRQQRSRKFLNIQPIEGITISNGTQIKASDNNSKASDHYIMFHKNVATFPEIFQNFRRIFKPLLQILSKNIEKTRIVHFLPQSTGNGQGASHEASEIFKLY